MYMNNKKLVKMFQIMKKKKRLNKFKKMIQSYRKRKTYGKVKM